MVAPAFNNTARSIRLLNSRKTTEQDQFSPLAKKKLADGAKSTVTASSRRKVFSNSKVQLGELAALSQAHHGINNLIDVGDHRVDQWRAVRRWDRLRGDAHDWTVQVGK